MSWRLNTLPARTGLGMPCGILPASGGPARTGSPTHCRLFKRRRHRNPAITGYEGLHHEIVGHPVSRAVVKKLSSRRERVSVMEMRPHQRRQVLTKCTNSTHLSNHSSSCHVMENIHRNDSFTKSLGVTALGHFDREIADSCASCTRYLHAGLCFC